MEKEDDFLLLNDVIIIAKRYIYYSRNNVLNPRPSPFFYQKSIQFMILKVALQV